MVRANDRHQEVETIEAPLYEIRAASTAAGGTALTATAGLINLPFKTEWIALIPRNFSGATVVQAVLNLRLTIIQATDTLATASLITDISDEAQDGDATDIAMDGGTAAAGEFLYMGSPVPFRGVAVDLGTANDAATVLTVTYWNGDAWVTTGASDGTDNAGDSMKTDNGNVTWTVPAAWVRTKLANTESGVAKIPKTDHSLYWTRWVWSNALDAATTVDQFRPLNRSTTYAEFLSGLSYEQKIPNGTFQNVEALTDAGTANLIVNVGTRWGAMFE